ncbi:MAG TPA: hypothetical protein VLA56_09355 [Pseudomonadales bacterium]|nr:hypothetical protein [Pseudomonadales bacterium]
MMTLIRQIVGTTSMAFVRDALDPGAGHPPLEAMRRRWVRNLWIVVVPCLVALRELPNLLIALTLFAFILTFMILDEVGRR